MADIIQALAATHQCLIGVQVHPMKT